MKTLRYIGPAFVLMSLAACTSTPSDLGAHSAVAANIRAHSQAIRALPSSAARMTLAIRKYNKNKIEPPVNMHTTDSVSTD